jgi:hypothetical protein
VSAPETPTLYETRYHANPGDRKRFKAWALAHGTEQRWDAADGVDIEAYYTDYHAEIDARNAVIDAARPAADAAYNAIIDAALAAAGMTS